MTNVVIFIAGCLVMFLGWRLDKRAKRAEAEMDINDFTVRRPAFMVGISVAVMVFVVSITVFLALVALHSYSEGTGEWSSVLKFWPVLLFVLAVQALNLRGIIRCKVRVEGRRITSTPFFGKARSCDVDCITCVEVRSLRTGLTMPFSVKPSRAMMFGYSMMIAYRGREKFFEVHVMSRGYGLITEFLKREIPERCKRLEEGVWED